jgi:hypothetical protein
MLWNLLARLQVRCGPPRIRGRRAQCLVLAAWGAALLPGGSAQAYCRTTTASHCAECPRDPVTDCSLTGTPVSWDSSCLSFSLSSNALSRQVGEATARAMLRKAFETWESVSCPPSGLRPSVHVSERFGDTLCTRAEYNPSQGNAHAIMFRDEGWSYGGVGSALATTTVTFDEGSGRILDADMEINSTITLSLDGVQPKAFAVNVYDLQSILTHEAGHFLGLDHSKVPGSIMKLALDSREVSTVLGVDDVAAICAVYPPEAPAACEPEPTGGFSPQCGLDPTSGGACGIHPGAPGETPALSLTGLLLCAAALVRPRGPGRLSLFRKSRGTGSELPAGRKPSA